MLGYIFCSYHRNVHYHGQNLHTHSYKDFFCRTDIRISNSSQQLVIVRDFLSVSLKHFLPDINYVYKIKSLPLNAQPNIKGPKSKLLPKMFDQGLIIYSNYVNLNIINLNDVMVWPKYIKVAT